MNKTMPGFQECRGLAQGCSHPQGVVGMVAVIKCKAVGWLETCGRKHCTACNICSNISGYRSFTSFFKRKSALLLLQNVSKNTLQVGGCRCCSTFFKLRCKLFQLRGKDKVLKSLNKSVASATNQMTINMKSSRIECEAY